MLGHHLFAFAERLPIGFQYNSIAIGNVDLIVLLGNFGKICVALFMFLGGYGMMEQYKLRQEGVLSRRILSVYKGYWRVFVIFVPIGFLLFSEQPDYFAEVSFCHVFSSFDLQGLLSTFVGLSDNYNHEWWFLKVYLCTGFLGYLYIVNVKKKGGYTEYFFVILIAIFAREVLPAIAQSQVFGRLKDNWFYMNLLALHEYSPTFFAGIVFAKYDGFSLLRKEIRNVKCTWMRNILCIGGIILIILLRTHLLGAGFDIIMVPLFMALVVELLDNMKYIRRVVGYLGKHSTNMWLVHSFYCYYYYEVVKLVYFTSNPWLVWAWLTVLSLGSSIVIDYLYKIPQIVRKQIEKKSLSSQKVGVIQ